MARRTTSPDVESPEAPEADIGRTRKPFGSQEQKMAYPDREGDHRHWFNDNPGRIHRAKEAGYTHVEDHEGENMSLVVGSREGGGPLLAYLMEIPQEWWEEDMKKNTEQTDKVMDAIQRGKSNNPDDAQYVPSQGISIRQGR